MSTAKPTPILAFVGTYSRRGSEGIYVFHLDTESGELERLSTVGGLENPSFLDVRADGQVLCAVSEVSDMAGEATGALSSFAIDAELGTLSLLSQQKTRGTHPCHVAIDKTGCHALVANYTSGSVAVLPLGNDGVLDEAVSFVQHAGSSVDPRRQDGPHAHSVTLSPDNRFALVADLGVDQVLVYSFDAKTGALQPAAQPHATLAPRAGPRHVAFHPRGDLVYVINELGNTITAFTYNAADAGLEAIQTVPSLPAGFDGVSHTADIHVHPNGRFVYGSNRGHDSIVIHAVDPTSGCLQLKGHVSTQGQIPRNFALDASGTFLFAANQDTDTIITFRIDADTGLLEATGQVAHVPAPVCIKMSVPVA